MKTSCPARCGWCAVLSIGLIALAGCSSDEPPPSSVSGSVTLDDQPLTAGSIVLIEESGAAASAEVQPDGTYSLQCLPGNYHVAVSPPPPPDPLASTSSSTPAPAVEIPKLYQDPGSSGLVADVKTGSNTMDFHLDSKAK